MNRRNFLKSLVVLGGAVALPFDALASTPETTIDAVWEKALSDPYVFYVRDYGTLTTDPCYDSFPKSRSELYGIEVPSDILEVRALADNYHEVSRIIDDAMYEVDASGHWKPWLNALQGDRQQQILHQVVDWLEGSPDDRDWEYANLSGQTGQGSALWYFRDEFEYCDDFNIVIVEGDCPGSSYFAAELRMDINDANERAEELGIPIRFAWLGF